MFCRVLSDPQIVRIHEASLAVLERTGVQVPHDEMLARFADSGARVDRAAQRVHIPPDLVARSLASAGKQFTLYGRDLGRTAPFGQGRRNYNTSAGQGLWIDEPGGPRRPATLTAVAAAARFADALEHITLVGAMADPQDRPVGVRTVEAVVSMLRHTTKPLHFWYHDRASARYLNEILVALRGDEARASQYPAWYPFLEPISPLRFPFNGLDLLLETSRLNLPVPIGPMAQTGLSAPGTLAGTMVQENAEILAGVCITQLIRPGTAVCYGGLPHAFDMRTTQLVFGGPEQVLFGVAMTQMGRSYGLPVYVNVGIVDAKRPDAQAGLEVAATLLPAAAAGADVFGHVGIAGVDQGASFDMLVLQHEAIAYVESALRDIDMSDEALGLDEIDDAGPGGTFIDREHTVAHFRRELWFPRLLDRSYYDAWREAGAESLEVRCGRRKEEILAGPGPDPVPEDLDRALDDIVASARRHLG